jgi:hypothetical protein
MRTFGDLAWWLASRWLPDAMQLLPIFVLELIFGPDHQKCVRTYFGAAERPLGAGRSVRAVAQTHQKQDSSSNC